MIRNEDGQICFVEYYCCPDEEVPESESEVWQYTVTFMYTFIIGHVLIFHDFVLDFLKGRSMDEIGPRSLYPKVTVYFVSKCFHIVTDYPILDYPMVLSFEFMGIIMSQDE